MKIVILCDIFLMIRNLSIIKVFVVPKKKKNSIGLVFRRSWTWQKAKLKVRSSLGGKMLGSKSLEQLANREQKLARYRLLSLQV